MKKKVGIILLVVLLILFVLLLINKNIQLNKKNNILESNYKTIINENKITHKKLLENGLYEDYSETTQDILIDLYNSYSVMANRITIPAYGPISKLSVLSDINTMGGDVISRDENMTFLSVELYVPNWIFDIKKDIKFENETTYIIKECSLLINPDIKSTKTTILLYSTPVKKIASYNNWIYVESLVKRDTNTLYKGWVREDNLGMLKLEKSMINRFCYIEKGKIVSKKNTEAIIVMNQWGRITDDETEYYVVTTFGANTYKIKKEEVLFLENFE